MDYLHTCTVITAVKKVCHTVCMTYKTNLAGHTLCTYDTHITEGLRMIRDKELKQFLSLFLGKQ